MAYYLMKGPGHSVTHELSHTEKVYIYLKESSVDLILEGEDGLDSKEDVVTLRILTVIIDSDDKNKYNNKLAELSETIEKIKALKYAQLPGIFLERINERNIEILKGDRNETIAYRNQIDGSIKIVKISTDDAKEPNNISRPAGHINVGNTRKASYIWSAEESKLIFASLKNRKYNKNKEAIANLTKLIKANSTSAQLYVLRGDAYFETRKLDNAVSDYLRAIDVDSTNSHAWLGLGRSYHLKGEIDSAIECYNKAASIDNKLFAAYLNLGLMLYEKKDMQNAIENYKKAIDLEIDNYSPYLNLGNLYLDMKEYDLALKNYKIALKLNPNSIVHYNLGRFFTIRNEIQAAIKEFNIAIKIVPNNGFNYRGRAQAYLDIGMLEEAMTDLNIAIKLGDSLAYFYRGNLYKQKGDYKEAIQDYTNAIRLEPKDDAIYNNRANAYTLIGNWNKAIKDYSTAISIDPNDSGHICNRGIAYVEIGDMESANADFRKAIQLGLNNSQSYNNLGLIYKKMNKSEDAIIYFKKAIELDPQDGAAYCNIGNIYQEKGDLDNAIRHFNFALKQDGEITTKVESLIKRGLSYLQKGEKKQAEKDFNEVKNKFKDKIPKWFYSKCAEVYFEKGNFSETIENLDKFLILVPNDAKAYFNRGLAKEKLDDLKGAAADRKRATELKIK